MVSSKLYVFVYGNKQIISFTPLAHFDYNIALVIFEDLITNEHKMYAFFCYIFFDLR